MVLGFGGVGQFRPDDSRQPGVRISLGAVPGLPAAATRTFDAYDIAADIPSGAIGNGLTVTRLAPGLWDALDYGTSKGPEKRGRPMNALAREQRRQAAIAASRGATPREGGTWSDNPEPERRDGLILGAPELESGATWTAEPPVAATPRTSEALRAVLTGQADSAVLVDPVLMGGRLDNFAAAAADGTAFRRDLDALVAADLADAAAGIRGEPLDMRRAERAANYGARIGLPAETVNRLVLAAAGASASGKPIGALLSPAGTQQMVSREVIPGEQGRIGAPLQGPEPSPERLQQVWGEYLAQSTPIRTLESAIEAQDPVLERQIKGEIAQIALQLAADFEQQGIPADPAKLLGTATRIHRESQVPGGEVFEIDWTTGLPSDVPPYLRGKAGALRAENLQANADFGGSIGADPTTTAGPRGARRQPNAYGVIQVPEVDASGRIVAVRTIDPSAVADVVVNDPDSTFSSEVNREVTFGRLAQEAMDANATPVITKVGLTAAQDAGRFLPRNGPAKGLRGFLVRSDARSSGVAPAQLAELFPGAVIREAPGSERIFSPEEIDSRLSPFAGRTVDREPGTLIVEDSSGKPLALLRAQQSQGVYTGLLDVADPVYEAPGVRPARVQRAIPYAQRGEDVKDGFRISNDTKEIESPLSRIGGYNNRDWGGLRRDLATALGGVRRQQVVDPSDAARVNVNRLRDALEGGFIVVPRGAGRFTVEPPTDATGRPVQLDSQQERQLYLEQLRQRSLSLDELTQVKNAASGQRADAIKLDTPFFDVYSPSGRLVEQLGFQRDESGERYTGQFGKLKTVEVGLAPLIGGLGGDLGPNRGSYSGTRQRVEQLADLAATAGGLSQQTIAALPTEQRRMLPADPAVLAQLPTSTAALNEFATEVGKGAFMAGPSVASGDRLVADMLIRGELTPDQVAEIYPAGSYGRMMLQQEVLSRSKGTSRLTFLDERGPDLAPRGPAGMSPMEFYRGGAIESVAPRQTSQTPAQGDGSLQRALAQQLFGPVSREPAQARSVRPMATQAMRQPDPSQTSGNPSGGRSTIGQQILNALREESLEAIPAAQPAVARELPAVDEAVRQIAPGRRRGPYAGAPYYRSLG